MLLVLLSVSTAGAFATPAPGEVPLTRLSADSLVVRGKRLMDAGDRRDSALMCFGEITRRYYERPSDVSLHPAAMTALRQLGNMHISPSYDFSKAFEYLNAAIGIAQDDDMTSELPRLYISMAALWINNETAAQSADASQKAEKWFKQGWGIAMREADREALVKLALNMAVYSHSAHEHGFDKELGWYLGQTFPPGVEADDYTRSYVEATMRLHQGDYRGAAQGFQESYDKIPSLRNTNKGSCRINSTSGIAKALWLGGDTLRAFNTLKTQIAALPQAAPGEDALFLYRELADYYRQAEMTDSAQAWEYRYMLRRDDARTLSNQNAMEQAALLAQIDHANRQARDLSVKRHKSQMMWVWVGAILLTICLTAAMGLWLRFQRRRARELYLQNQQLLSQIAYMKQQRTEAKYTASPVDAGLSENLYDHILHVLDTTTDLYSPGFTVDRLAELANTKTRYVSQAINEHIEGGFVQLLSDYRIREACRRLRDWQHYGNLTVESIAQGVGIMSRSTFSHTFKKSTGLSPAAYRRAARQES